MSLFQLLKIICKQPTPGVYRKKNQLIPPQRLASSSKDHQHPCQKHHQYHIKDAVIASCPNQITAYRDLHNEDEANIQKSLQSELFSGAQLTGKEKKIHVKQ